MRFIPFAWAAAFSLALSAFSGTAAPRNAGMIKAASRARVRDAGKGRVFYTAWGHDQRTWNKPQFVSLIENGIRWAAAAGGKFGKQAVTNFEI